MVAPPLISKFKVPLKLSISRLRHSQAKTSALAKQERREISKLLDAGKVESARIKSEAVILKDISVELYEILELYCELMLARIGMFEGKECDPGLEEAVKTMIHAAPRTDIKELHQVAGFLSEKYGREFALAAKENKDGKVAERVLKKLRIATPDPELVTLYLKEIARAYGVHYPASRPSTPPIHDDDDYPSGGAKETTEAPLVVQPETAAEELAKATPPKAMRSPINVAPPSPSTENVHPTIKLPDPPKYGVNPGRPKPVSKPAPTPAVTKSSLDDDDLARRFAALKRL